MKTHDSFLHRFVHYDIDKMLYWGLFVAALMFLLGYALVPAAIASVINYAAATVLFVTLVIYIIRGLTADL